MYPAHTPTCAETETHRVQGTRMIWIVLAAGLGVANFIAVVLLFRRLRRDLNRQLRDMRAERNSELILHALQAVPDQQAVQAANGTGEPELPPLGPQPVRRKKHLGLFIGGAVAAMVTALGAGLRAAWDTRRGQVVGTAVGVAAVAATTVFLLAYEPWEDGGSGPPSSAPTASPPWVGPPDPTQPPPSERAPTSPAPAPSGSRDSTTPTTPTPKPTEPRSTTTEEQPESGTPAPQPSASSSEPEPPPPPGNGTPADPTPTVTPEPPPAEPQPGTPPPRAPAGAPVARVPCLSLAVAWLAEVGVCLGGGG